MERAFDHEKLDVYQIELQFIAWLTDFSSKFPITSSTLPRGDIVKSCVSERGASLLK